MDTNECHDNQDQARTLLTKDEKSRRCRKTWKKKDWKLKLQGEIKKFFIK